MNSILNIIYDSKQVVDVKSKVSLEELEAYFEIYGNLICTTDYTDEIMPSCDILNEFLKKHKYRVYRNKHSLKFTKYFNNKL